MVIVVAARLAQFFSQAHLQTVDYGIAVEHKVFGLLLQRIDIVGVAVTDRNHGMATVKVEIFGAAGIVGVAAHALHNLDIE